MTPEEFIHKHITAALVAEGFPDQVAKGGADCGLEHYRCMSQASKKGAAYDDCLYRARVWAQGQTSKAERKSSKKKLSQGSLL
ncbi:hypothetical protein [Serratia sp. UGAL515B_01]|uniref:hypothetical protein n=1 Tax=Serratia sp. UGAL515B_01 TaxID=2986763 RepID=UPI00295522CF|nr:hypothetical protein [Serratia sp. UGAL515B_01]WON77810.1 hypothetical protein OK023_03745 [Serratia sp. UGAL515B_01]